MTPDEREKALNREQVAARRLQEVAQASMNDNSVVENIEVAYVQNQLCLAAIRGLTRLLLHKGVLSERDMMGSMAWAYEERTSQIENMGREIQIASSPIVTPQ
jgi:hypothetical protein